MLVISIAKWNNLKYQNKKCTFNLHAWLKQRMQMKFKEITNNACSIKWNLNLKKKKWMMIKEWTYDEFNWKVKILRDGNRYFRYMKLVDILEMTDDQWTSLPEKSNYSDDVCDHTNCSYKWSCSLVGSKHIN